MSGAERPLIVLLMVVVNLERNLRNSLSIILHSPYTSGLPRAMDGNLATTYTLIHSFLTKRSHSKAAQALKKAVKEFVILKDDIDIDGPQLDDIIKEWKALNVKKALPSPSDSGSDSDSASSDDSSDSSSDSSDSEASGKTKTPLVLKPPKSSPSDSDSDDSDGSSVKLPVTKVLKPSPSLGSGASSDSKGSSSDSSSSDSDSGSESDDESSDSGLQVKPTKVKKLTKRVSSDRGSSKTLSSGSKQGETSNSEEVEEKSAQKTEQKMKAVINGKGSRDEDSSDSDDSSSSSSEDEVIVKEKEVSKEVKMSSSSSSGSSSSSSDSEEEVKEPEEKVSKKVQESSSSSSSSSDSDSDAKIDDRNKTSGGKSLIAPAKPESEDRDQVKITKKRRTSESGAAVTTATTNTVREEENGPRSTGRIKGENGKSGRKINTPFRRVDPDKVPEHVVKDNRYEAKAGPSNDYGQRAHADLIVTRGAGFRKEKNKKKRGSYRGGEITMESHSFKFT